MSAFDQSKPKFSARRLLRVALVSFVILVVALLLERWRGQYALAVWKRAMTAEGEVFDLTKLWPPPAASALAFSNQFAQARNQLPEDFQYYCGTMNGIAEGQAGKARRGSQEPWPLVHSPHGTNSWGALDASARQAAPALQSIRELMKDPPAGTSMDIAKQVADGSLPNYVNVRVNAQALSSASLNELHNGNLAGAMEDLVALSAFQRLHEQDPSLINYMIRIALTGLGVSVYWDALQADGWTDDQLAQLQRACQSAPLLSQLSKVLASERAVRLYYLERFRSGSYEQWIGRYQSIYASFGARLPFWDVAVPVRLWRQWGFHPLWSFAWADQEKLHYAQHLQADIRALREGAKQGSWRWLSQQLDEIHQQYQPPMAKWRFYFQLPILEKMSEIIGSAPKPQKIKATVIADTVTSPQNICPFADFSKAWFITHKNLTLNNLVITAIALKRHHLRHGKYPAALTELTPEFLSAVPLDLMDGQPLRYHLNPNGSFTLYSIGDDFKDDGGKTQSAPQTQGSMYDPWRGPDWVWPQI